MNKPIKKNTKKTKLFLFSILGIILTAGLVFAVLTMYKTPFKDTIKIDVPKSEPLPPQSEIEKFLKVEREKGQPDVHELKAVKQSTKEFVSQKTYLLKDGTALPNNVVKAVYDVYFDPRVMSDEEVRVAVETDYKRLINDSQNADKYVDIGYEWQNGDQVIIEGKENKTTKRLKLTMKYTIKYDAMKMAQIVSPNGGNYKITIDGRVATNG